VHMAADWGWNWSADAAQSHSSKSEAGVAQKRLVGGGWMEERWGGEGEYIL